MAVEASSSSDVMSTVRRAVSAVTDSEWTSGDMPLMDVGMDSIAAVEFRQVVKAKFPWVAIPAVTMFDYPTI